MPGVRDKIVWDLPRSRLAPARQWGLAAQLRAKGYGTALVMPRTWKAAIAPALAGIPERVGFFGEARFGLINRMRWGEKPCPASSTRTPRWRCRTARHGRRNGRCRNSAFPPTRRPLAADERLGHRPRGRPGPGLGRRLETLDLLPRGRAAAGRARPRRLGGRRPRRKGAGAGDRRGRRRARPRPHRHGFAQRHPGDGGGERRDLQRLRA